MRTVTIHEAGTHLSRLIDSVIAGEEIVITRDGKPVARLAPPLESPRPEPTSPEPRSPGALAGNIQIADDHDAPLPESIAAAFRGETR